MSDPSNTPNPDPGAVERFMRLFADHHRSVFCYVLALVGDEHQAEEVFQDVSVTLWRRCGDFEPGTSFMAWAKTVSLNQVRNWRRTQSRDRLVFSDAMVEQLAEDHASIEEEAAGARAALRRCLDKLRDIDRELIDRAYAESAPSFRQIAAELGRPANTVYKALNRIRRALHDCVEATLAEERAR